MLKTLKLKKKYKVQFFKHYYGKKSVKTGQHFVTLWARVLWHRFESRWFPAPPFTKNLLEKN